MGEAGAGPDLVLLCIGSPAFLGLSYAWSTGLRLATGTGSILIRLSNQENDLLPSHIRDVNLRLYLKAKISSTSISSMPL